MRVLKNSSIPGIDSIVAIMTSHLAPNPQNGQHTSTRERVIICAHVYNYRERFCNGKESASCLASKMSVPVVDLVREGCETLEFHVGEINPHSVGHAF